MATTYNLEDESDPTAFDCSRLGYKWYPFDGTPAQVNYPYAANTVAGGPLQTSYWVLGLRRPKSPGGDGEASLPSGLSTALVEPFDPSFQFGSSTAVNPPAGLFQPWLYRWTFGVPQRYPCA